MSIDLKNHRNIGIIAHIDAGKTTTTERILFYTGKTHKIGETHDGASQMDWMDQEKERGITITSAATYCKWGDVSINIIDTPGHVDFTVEVERSMRVLDGGIVILDGSAGVEPQSETVWRQADKYGVSRFIYVNKMTKMGADFEMSMNSIFDRFSKSAVAIQLPIGADDSFSGVVDLVENKAFKFEWLAGETVVEIEIPADMKDLVKEKRFILMEKVAEIDEVLLDRYLETGELTIEEIKEGLKKGTRDATLFPVLCGDALADIGIQLVLNAVVAYLPNPLEAHEMKGINLDTDEETLVKVDTKWPFRGLAFKVATDPFIGRLIFFRVYSGTVTSGSYIYNTSRWEKERIGRIVRMHANTKEDITEIGAGDIGALVGLKKTFTGDTLTDLNNKDIVLESMDIPEPVISIAIEPKTKADQERMGIALQKLAEEDPTFRISSNEETGQTLIAGMGELHLDIIVDRMKREFKVEANVGKPQVAFRETLSKPVDIEYKYVKQSGGRGMFAHVLMKVEPTGLGSGYAFESIIKGGAIPKEYIPHIDKGVQEAMTAGLVAGYPVTDIKVTVYDGSFHEVDSSEIAFKICWSLAFKDAMKKSTMQLLEPIMKVEVVTPEQFMGDVIGNLQSKRGKIQNMTDRLGSKIIDAKVPLSSMFGYATELRSMTQGRASYSMELLEYDVVPQNVVAEIKKERGY